MDDRDIKRTVLEEVPSIGMTPPPIDGVIIDPDKIDFTEPEEPFRSITLHTSKRLASQWGAQWWKEVRPELEAAGWIVSLPVEYSDEELAQSYFEINRDGVVEKIFGKQPKEAFKWQAE